MGGKKGNRERQKEGKKGYSIIKETAEEKHCGQKKMKVDTNTLYPSLAPKIVLTLNRKQCALLFPVSTPSLAKIAA